MDQKTHNLLIEKLEAALKGIPSASTERQSITLRLADLYADRARLQVLSLQEKKCQPPCSDGREDRQRALLYYEKIVNSLGESQRGDVLLQMAHLYQLVGKQNLAIKSLQTLIQSGRGRQNLEKVARAHSQLGEILYKQNKFSQAETHFRNALTYSGLQNSGFVWYRMAWAQLNQGKVELATSHLVHVLQTQELLETKNQDGLQFDHSFHEDVARDLALFLARGRDVGTQDIDKLLSLTPDSLRRQNLYAFASELERLGKKFSAILAWRAYFQEIDGSVDQGLETQIHLAQLQWDMGRRASALEEWSKAMELWRQRGCQGENCPELAKRCKNFVTTWHKVEKTRPSRQVLSAYKIYLQGFSQDLEMAFKAATVAEQQKDYKSATNLYGQAAVLAHGQTHRLLEPSLLKQIEMAELSQDKSSRMMAYDQYLELSRDGKKNVEVRYQKAQLTYDMGQTVLAHEQFMALAQENKTDHRDLRVKAADLALDTLATLKNDVQMYEKSFLLASRYPERSKEYSHLQAQAAIELAAKVLNQKGSVSDSQFRTELARLNNLNLKQISQKEKILVFRNRLSLAERLHDLQAVKLTAQQMLQLSGLQAQERELALGRLVWVAELKMDFSTAFKSAQQMADKHLSEEDRNLRLAILSELAGYDATIYYQKALKKVRKKEQAQRIRVALVRQSHHPWQELKRYAKDLEQSPALFSRLILDLYSKDGREQEVRTYLRRPALRNSALNQIFTRREFLAQWKSADAQLMRHRLSTYSEALMQRTLSQRVKLLQNQDQLARQAVLREDWLGQLAVLTTMAREYERLGQELVKLPVPRQLKGKNRERYLSLLQSQARQFKDRAAATEKKLNQFWDNTQALDEIKIAYRGAQGYWRGLLVHEIQILSRLCRSSSEQKQFISLLAEKPSYPSKEDLNRLKARLQEDPFDSQLISEFKSLSEKRGDFTMVAFLDSRLQQFHTSGVR